MHILKPIYYGIRGQVTLLIAVTGLWYSCLLAYFSHKPLNLLWQSVVQYGPACMFVLALRLAATVHRNKGVTKPWKFAAGLAETLAISPLILLLSLMVVRILKYYQAMG
jgi:hypothetical protein